MCDLLVCVGQNCVFIGYYIYLFVCLFCLLFSILFIYLFFCLIETKNMKSPFTTSYNPNSSLCRLYEVFNGQTNSPTLFILSYYLNLWEFLKELHASIPLSLKFWSYCVDCTSQTHSISKSLGVFRFYTSSTLATIPCSLWCNSGVVACFPRICSLRL